ncbi:MAG: type VI secretion protein ImpB [Planctomycetota bacterium]
MDSARPLRWLFLDMNSFFASVEQHDNPKLRGRPVGVTPTQGDHSGCIAVSTEGKRAGVRNGMRPPEARRVCPGFVAIKARPDRYVELFHSLKKSTEKHAPIFKSYSVDEWCVKLLGDERTPDGATALARRIKQQIIDDHSPALRCSIGLAPTRLLAKIAGELQKPDGLTVLTLDDMPAKVAHCRLTDFPGIADGTVVRLFRHGVTNPQELWDMSRQDARKAWGSVQGEHWWYGFHGIDVPEVKTKRSSMGHAHILPPHLRNEEGAYAVAVRLLCRAAARLRLEADPDDPEDHDQPYWAHGLCLSIQYTNYERFATQRTFPATQDTPTLLDQLRACWSDQPRREPAIAPKKLAVTLVDLLPRESVTLPLFSEQLTRGRRGDRVSRAIDTVNRALKKSLQKDRHLRKGRPDAFHLLHLGSVHESVTGYAMDDKIAFGRVPERKVKI